MKELRKRSLILTSKNENKMNTKLKKIRCEPFTFGFTL